MAQADKAFEDWEAQVSQETDPIKIEAGLTDQDPIVRQEFARKTNVQLSPDQIERGLADESDDVRLAFAKRTDFTPTPGQAERGLTDSNVEIATAFAERKDFTPTSAQVLRGVTQQRLGRDPDDNSVVDVNQSIREAFLRRDDAVMDQSDFDVAMELTDGADREAIENMQRRNIAHQAASQAAELNPAAARIMARQQQVLQDSKGKQLPDVSRHIEAARKRNEDLERQQQQQQVVDMKKGRSL